MFRQIQLHPDDQRFQLLFKRESPFQEISIYQLTAVVFGLRSSHFLAIHTLKQLVKDEGQNYRLAAAALEKQIFVLMICFLVPIL